MKFTSLTHRFMIWFTAVSLLPILLTGYSLLRTFETEMQKTAIQQVSAIADMKAEQIDAYLRERLLDTKVIQTASTTREAMREFTQVFIQSGVGSDAYRQLDASYRDHFLAAIIHRETGATLAVQATPDRRGERGGIERDLEFQRRVRFIFQRSHHQRGVLVLETRHYGFAAGPQAHIVCQHLKYAFTIDLQRQHAFNFFLNHDWKSHKGSDCTGRWRIVFKI